MHVFLTGGSGFVGGHFIEVLRRRGHRVTAAARSQASADAVRAKGAEPWLGAVNDVESVAEALQGIDVVVHAAAHLKMWGPMAEFEASNIGLTEAMLQAAKRARVRHFVHISAASVVMDEPRAVLDVDEVAPLTARASLAYSFTKARAEELVVAASCHAMTTLVLRPPFIWGPGDAIDRDLGEAIARGRFGWFDGGRYPYATCHVLNLAHAVALAVETPEADGCCFVTDGESVELRSFLERRISAAGLTPPTMSVPSGVAWAIARAAEFVWKAMGLRSDPPLTREVVRLMGYPFTVDISRLRRRLGYEPVITVDEGLQQLRVVSGLHQAPRDPANAPVQVPDLR